MATSWIIEPATSLPIEFSGPGRSPFDSAEIARAHADQVLLAPRGRASQMNAGAAACAAEVLLFLHADTTLPAGAIVSDIVYVPLETPLLAAARAAGYHPVDGIGMLLHQAAPGFERWFGKRPDVDEETRQFVLRG